jgi:hypothetical protein
MQLDDGATHSTNASCGTGYNDGAVKRHASASDIRGRRQINCAFARYLISSFPRKCETGCRPADGCSNDWRQPPYRPGRADDLEHVRAPRASEIESLGYRAVVGICRFFVEGL